MPPKPMAKANNHPRREQSNQRLSLNNLKSLLSGDDIQPMTLDYEIYHSDTSTADLLEILKHAMSLVETAVQAHTDISDQAGSYNLLVPVKEAGGQVGEFLQRMKEGGLQEGQTRDRCMANIMRLAALTKVINRVGEDVRHRLGGEREEAERARQSHGRSSRGVKVRIGAGSPFREKKGG
ncbi:hypothetical protein B0A50_04355 [Salinomyces thailandicus]|uniref:Uncharacterized protein n=1 Tax=Salinomyces thailandicus TaxID=706561 RepID=A0A4U0U0E1_9PEZI|nr:hypothetical protein B0A50_04355 [Salinomyces thailandica]